MIELDIILVASMLCIACVLPGVFLVLRGMSLMSDAISHASLLGIVIVFFFIHSLDSPLLILGASLAGILTVSITEWLIQTKRLKKDAAIGLVFPIFFSIAVILISRYAHNVHIDSDNVLFGDIAFVPFDRLSLYGLDIGPKALWIMGFMAIINGIFIWVFYKELKVTSFDPLLANALGFSSLLLHYLLMSLTSLTAVASFQIVGSILVVALMITPPATAYLLSYRLSSMIGLSIVLSILAAVGGYGMASVYNVSIGGSMATMSGIFFVFALVFSPSQGILSKLYQSQQQRERFYMHIMLVQLLDHEGKANEKTENTVSNLIEHMGWSIGLARKISKKGVQKGLIWRHKNQLRLTPLGREMAKRAMLV